MTEQQAAIDLANRLLDEPNSDPDDDLRTLSRQLLRRTEQVAVNPRAQELFAALLDFLNQWKNRGETTSLHEWHMRMKESAERAEAVLNKRDVA